MKRKTPKGKAKPRTWLMSGGYDPDCELCRALSEEDPEVFGKPLQGDMFEIREVLDLDRVQELFRSLR